MDAFTDEVFSGNPAAVCLLSGPADAVWMQSVAREMNLSETAFVEARSGGYGLRWFTPMAEVGLCGHATLASAHVLYETGLAADGQPIRFESVSGPLIATREAEEIVLDFPVRPAAPMAPPFGLLPALGLSGADWAGRSEDDFLVVLDAEEEVVRLQPDMSALSHISARGVIVTAPTSRPGTDFVSRFFGPAVGVPEDPVTGSAHCTLAPYWAQRLGLAEMTGYQASARGGRVRVRVQGDRVMLAGAAVTVFSASLATGALPPPAR